MKKLLPIALCAVLCGCGETTVVDLDNSKEVAEMQNVMELEYRDWTATAEKMTNSMLASGAFARIKNPVIAIGEIQNDTMQRFDTDILIKKIRKTLVNSGRAQVTTGFRNNKSAEDETTHAVRNTRGNAEYDASTIAGTGTLVAPNMSLTGKMIQRNLKLQSGWFSSVDTRVEYYLQLTLSDVKTGLSVWEDEQPIVKEGDHAPTW
ncbi:MAG: penicillin-binding protein activator LpoB [Alphaproteobacteria bacterium]|nr:penicillin-binding protein activator LpoB [Alphaproteobacteria bacterium]MBR4806401.1 penicillin-binding protein activator LpoB [Alphaproteobacteria bacterium]